MITVPTGKMLTREDGTEYPEMEPYVEHEYSDTLMTLLLKANLPAKYREKVEQMHSGTLMVENVATIRARLAARKKP